MDIKEEGRHNKKIESEFPKKFVISVTESRQKYYVQMEINLIHFWSMN